MQSSVTAGKVMHGTRMALRLWFWAAYLVATHHPGVAKIVARHAKAAGIPTRLAHPHALRSYYATTLASEGIAVHRIATRLGHASIQTTSRYLAETERDVGSIGEVLDRRHQGAARARMPPRR